MIKNVFKSSKFIMLLALMLIVAACGSNSGTNSGGNAGGDDSGSGDKIDRIQVTAAQHPSGFLGLPFEVGIEKGFYAEENIEITGILPASGGGTSVRNILSGDLAFGSVAPFSAVQSYLAGANLKIIGGNAQTFADTVFAVRKDSGFTDIKDLEGHTWAYTSSGSASHAISYLLFDEFGLDTNTMKIVSSGGISEGMTLLRNGEIDIHIIIEPIWQQNKDEFQSLFRVPELIPWYQENVLVTRSTLLKENPDLVKRFMRAYKKSINWIYDNVEEAAEIQAKYSEADLDNVLEATKILAEAQNWAPGLNVESMNNVIKGAILSGEFKEGTKIDWNDLIDQSFLDEEDKIDISQLVGGSN